MSFRIIRKVSSRGEIREKVLDVSGDLLRIGRGALNELQLDNLTISLNQAEIRRDEGSSYVLRDVSQGQSIYLNHVPVKEAVLQSGDVIKIENYSVTVSQPEPGGLLVLAVDEGPIISTEPSLALMPKLLLASGRWTKWRLATVLLLVISVGSILAGVLGHGTVFMPGDVSLKHSKFASQCEVCHASVKPVWNYVKNAACQECHRPDILSPSHFKQDLVLSRPPLCASCHLEHKGQKLLADVSDVKCVQCHADLKAKDQSVPDIAAVHNFSTDHPEFAVTQLRPSSSDKGIVRVRLDDKERLKDDGQLKLNHALHLKLEKDYLDNRGMKPLTCSNCHRMDDEGHNMQPISFQRDCVQCHSGDIDLAPLLPGRRVAHGRQLDDLRQQLDEIFSAVYLQAHPEEAKQPEHLRWIPGRRLPGQPQTPQERYVVDGRTEGERILLSPKVKKCLKCHRVEEGTHDQATVDGAQAREDSPRGINVSEDTQPQGEDASLASPSQIVGGDLPRARIAKVGVPEKWLPYNRFDHRAHAAIPEIKTKGEGNWCLPCHENAAGSVRSEDVLLPSISLCRTCHFESGGAQASCRSCHEFHVPHKPGERPLMSFHSQPAHQLSSRVEEFRYV